MSARCVRAWGQLPSSVGHQEARDEDVGAGQVGCLELQPSQAPRWEDSAPAVPARLHHRHRASSRSVLLGLGHEYQFARRRRAFEQLVSTTRIGQRQALGHNRVDLAPTKQLEQRAEVLSIPVLVRDA
jgi:hypothetical protein